MIDILRCIVTRLEDAVDGESGCCLLSLLCSRLGKWGADD